MAVERTLSIIKPDAVAKNVIGEIYTRFERAGLQDRRCAHDAAFARGGRRLLCGPQGAPVFQGPGGFHDFGPGDDPVLEGEDAIQKNRDLMGATDPKKAEKGTIRADFAQSIDANAVHGSDSAENAAVEIAYFFPTLEICSR